MRSILLRMSLAAGFCLSFGASHAARPPASQPASRISSREQNSLDMGYQPVESILTVTGLARAQTSDAKGRFTLVEFTIVRRWTEIVSSPDQQRKLKALHLRETNANMDPRDLAPCRVLVPVVEDRYPIRLLPSFRSKPHAHGGYDEEWIPANRDFTAHRSLFPTASRSRDEWRSVVHVTTLFAGDLRLAGAAAKLLEYEYVGDMEFQIESLRKQHDADATVLVSVLLPRDPASAKSPLSPGVAGFQPTAAHGSKPGYKLTLRDVEWLPAPISRLRIGQDLSEPLTDADQRILGGVVEIMLTLPRKPPRDKPISLLWRDLDLAVMIGG